jgi:hypothetical protein
MNNSKQTGADPRAEINSEKSLTDTRKGKPFKVLRQLFIDENRKRFPSVPDHCRVIPKYQDKTANGLTRCIIDFLKFSGHQSERINSTGRVIDHRKSYTDTLGHVKTIGGVKYIPTAGTRGTSDISATIQGKSVKIEIKIKSDRQSEYQKEYQRQIEQAGGLYFIARSFDQFYNWYNETFQEGGQ